MKTTLHKRGGHQPAVKMTCAKEEETDLLRNEPMRWLLQRCGFISLHTRSAPKAQPLPIPAPQAIRTTPRSACRRVARKYRARRSRCRRSRRHNRARDIGVLLLPLGQVLVVARRCAALEHPHLASFDQRVFTATRICPRREGSAGGGRGRPRR